MSWEHAAEARAALNAIVTDPEHGVAALSSAQTMSNLLKDLLPDAPREKSILVAAAEAGLANNLRQHVDQGMDPNTAIRLTASSFSSTTPFTPEACTWVTGEIATALGISHGGGQPGGGAAPGFDRGPQGMPTRIAPIPGRLRARPAAHPGLRAVARSGRRLRRAARRPAPGGSGRAAATARAAAQQPGGYGQPASQAAVQPGGWLRPAWRLRPAGGLRRPARPARSAGPARQPGAEAGRARLRAARRRPAGRLRPAGVRPGRSDGADHPGGPGGPVKPRGSKRGLFIGGGIAAVVVVVVVIAASLSGGGKQPRPIGGFTHPAALRPATSPSSPAQPAARRTPRHRFAVTIMNPAGLSPVGTDLRHARSCSGSMRRPSTPGCSARRPRRRTSWSGATSSTVPPITRRAWPTSITSSASTKSRRAAVAHRRRAATEGKIGWHAQSQPEVQVQDGPGHRVPDRRHKASL